MSKQTIEAYQNVFEYINEKLIPLRGEAIIIDYEKAMRRAMKNVLQSSGSNMTVLGCWFHYCQALRRKVSKMPNLFENIRKYEKYSHLFRRFQCLPLLPLQYIDQLFRSLAKEALRLNSDLFATFVDYYDREWMKIVTPVHFCVYMRGRRTTAEAENFNGRLNKLFKTHGNFYLFCESLQKIVSASSNEVENYIDGTIQKEKKSAFYKKRNQLIKQISIQYEHSPKLMINALANVKNKIVYAEEDVLIEPMNVELAEDIELYGADAEIIYKEYEWSDDDDDEIEGMVTNTQPINSRSRTVNTLNENDDGISSYDGSIAGSLSG